MGRLTGIIIFTMGIAGAVILRLFFLQVSSAQEYKQQADRQHSIAVLAEPRRGDIFFQDSEGRLVPAAVTQRTFTLAGNPQHIENSSAAYEIISSVVALDEKEFLERAGAADKTYTVFGRGINRITAKKMQEVGIPTGFWLAEEEGRMYPNGEVGSQTIGFVGFLNNERRGQYGIEQQYEDVLRGERRSMVGEQSASGGFFSLSTSFFSKEQDGYDIVLTIDPHIQSTAHAVIIKTVEAWHATSGGVVVLDPKTGAVLAMDSVPAFDPNLYHEVENYDVFLNPLTQNVFEMGSIVKALTMAAGLDARAVTEHTTYYDAGSVRVGDAVISNYDRKGRGWQSMYDILDKSLNTGSMFVMEQLGKRAFRDYMNRFGLGDTTGIDVPNEVAGNLQNLERGGPVEYATASFGQGIAVTPIALASAFASIANGGELMKPYLVEEIRDGEHVVESAKPVVRRRVLRQETTEVVSRMLSQVVDNTLAGGLVHMPQYHIAAKTGTAQISRTDGPGYSDDFLHTFFGYAPAFDPKFIVLLYVEKPRGVLYASQTLAEPFRELTEFIINYYKIPPDR